MTIAPRWRRTTRPNTGPRRALHRTDRHHRTRVLSGEADGYFRFRRRQLAAHSRRCVCHQRLVTSCSRGFLSGPPAKVVGLIGGTPRASSSSDETFIWYTPSGNASVVAPESTVAISATDSVVAAASVSSAPSGTRARFGQIRTSANRSDPTPEPSGNPGDGQQHPRHHLKPPGITTPIPTTAAQSTSAAHTIGKIARDTAPTRRRPWLRAINPKPIRVGVTFGAIRMSLLASVVPTTTDTRTIPAR